VGIAGYAVSISFGACCTLFGQNTVIDSSAAQAYEAHAIAVTGQVSRIRDQRPWALSAGERVPIQQVITTGRDGYARFEVAGGSTFDIYSNSRVVFRQNAATAGDLLDVLAGRVRIHLQPRAGEPQQRIFTPVAVITAHEASTVVLAIDEDETLRIDVIEGQVRVQHTALPRNEPVLVKAIDAILVQRNEPISRRVDRGSLYRYTVKILSAITPGHSGNRNGEPVEGNKFLAETAPASPVLEGRR
jgi:hypothetical protein